ncbi:MAG: VanZ family protein [Bradyrhizobium sp.]
MIIVSRSVAWLLAAAVAFATLGPPRFRPHTDLGQVGEHTLAFVPIGLAFALAYPRHRKFAAAIAVVLTGLLELLQLLAPGRHARLQDFVVDALATLAGFAIVAVLDLAIGRSRGSTPSST